MCMLGVFRDRMVEQLMCCVLPASIWMYYNHSFTARAIFARLEWLLLTTGVCSICLTTKGIPPTDCVATEG